MIGKVNDDIFCRSILPNIGAVDARVVVGPQMGVDAAILKMGDGYMAIAEDPIFPGPTTSPDDFAWLAVHIGASDVAVMGIEPRYMTYSLLLPPGTKEEYIEELVLNIGKYARELGIAIVGGHTGFYGAVNVPTIGGITVWGLGKNYITPTGARKGDLVVMTKGAAIEAAALLACELEERLVAEGVAPDLIKRAGQRLREVTVVADAGIAAKAGGVTAMHDATEGGVARGLWEVAEASKVGMRIERAKVNVPEDIKAVCDCFALDPYEVISEGTLVLTCSPEKGDEILEVLHEAGLEAAVIGEVVPLEQGRLWIESNGMEKPIVPPGVDRFWDVFFNALALKDDARNDTERSLCLELGRGVKKLQEAGISALIPEIGANLAYCMPGARKLEDIAAIPGRMLRFKGGVATLGEPEMGCSKHMGGSLLGVRERFPDARCVINLYNDEKIRNACAALNFRVANMPVPPDYRQTDADFYHDLGKTLQACRQLPDIIEIPDRINLERLILVLGENLDGLIQKVLALSKKVQQAGQ